MTQLRRRLPHALAAAALAAMGCSLAIDVSDIDRGCSTNEKTCEGRCVAIDDPAYGCSTNHCAPCPLENAFPRCEENTCAVEACIFPFDCATATGCAINLRVDKQNCGHCGQICGADETCRAGLCSAN